VTSPAGASSVAGRWVVITGGSRGIGAELARRLAADGARLALVARGREALTTLARELGAEPVVCDVSDPAQVDRAAEQIGTLAGGAPDVVVNNAGTFSIAAAHKTSTDLFRRTLEVNLVAPHTGKLDKQTQRAVSVEMAEDPDEDGNVVRAVKRGFVWKERTFRAEEVVIKKWKEGFLMAMKTETKQ